MEKFSRNAVDQNRAAFFSLINHPLKFRLYLLKILPAAYFSGLKIVAATPERCSVSIPFKWFTKNPFRSTYFACLSIAVELSTGVLAMAHVYKRQPSVSMLVTNIEGRFYKKATDSTLFECKDGLLIKAAIERTITDQTPQEIKAQTIGTNKEGEMVSEFWITWSFKAK